MALFCSLFLLAQSRGQDVFVPRQSRAVPVAQSEKEHPAEVQPATTLPANEPAAIRQTQSAKPEPVPAPVVKVPAANPRSEKAETMKAPVVKEPAANPQPEKGQTAKVEPVKAPATNLPFKKIQSAKVEPKKAAPEKEPAANSQAEKLQSVKLEPVRIAPEQESTGNVRLLNGPVETAATRLADGFDFPVGKPDAEGYYKARGFRSGGHMGEDWDGVRGGDTDFNDPIYCIGDGVVVFARDVHLGWGNVVIVRHAYREEGTIKYIDSLYGHLNSILVSRGQKVARGRQIGTMGTAHGQYDAHLHLEIRKNIEIGMSKAKFQKNLSNYNDPSQFISSHRHLSGGGVSFRVAMNTFTHDSAFHFDDAPNFSAHKRGTAESSAALRRATSGTGP